MSSVRTPIFAAALVGLSSVSSVPPAAAQTPELSSTLREAASRHGILIGSAVRLEPLLEDPLYLEILSREFDTVTPEVELKWEHVHPSPFRYDFDRADAVIRIALENGLTVHGHTLVWHQQNPDWLTTFPFSRKQLIAILRNHISAVVGRYRGRVALWDVVNEPVQAPETEDDSLGDSVWLRRIGPEYIELAFRYAHEADPDARLIYNHVGFGQALSAPSLAIVEGLLRRGVPIHGVGFQVHVELDGDPPLEKVEEFSELMQQFASLGVEIYITEMDVALREPVTPRKLHDQADTYEAILKSCLEQPACKGFQTWGFTDRYTWITEQRAGWTAPLLFDVSYHPKAAYFALRDRLLVQPVPESR